MSRKEQNERFFANLGAVNAMRPDDLPPSQGGRYAGFGSSAPEPQESTRYGGTAQWQEETGDALKRGWGFLSSTFAQVGATASQRLNDPELQAQARGFAARVQSGLSQSVRWLSRARWLLLMRPCRASRTGSAYAAEGLKAASQTGWRLSAHTSLLSSRAAVSSALTRI